MRSEKVFKISSAGIFWGGQKLNLQGNSLLMEKIGSYMTDYTIGTFELAI
jgi:hypothetical protein